MKIRAWLVILGLGPFAPGCWADRPLYIATTPDAASPSGAAGTTGTAGSGGPAAAGTTGTAGGGGGSAVPGCDAVPVLKKYYCSLEGSCHDRGGSAAGFSLAELNQVGVDWKAKLVGVYPKGGGGPLRSQCFPSQVPYLVPGSSPPRGLLLDKLVATEPPCGDSMPLLGGPLSDAEKDCVMRWANELTTAP